MKATAWAFLSRSALLGDLPIQVQGEQDVGVLLVEVLAFRPVGLGADGQNDDAVLDHLAVGQRGGEVAHHARHSGDDGLEMDRDVGGVEVTWSIRASSAGPDQPAPPGGVELAGHCRPAVLALHQVHLIALVRQGQGRGHAGDAAAHHQGGLVDRPTVRYSRGYSSRALATAMLTRSWHFCVASLRLALVHPGALVADVGHLEEVLVEAGVAQHVLEDGLVGGGTAGRHHHPVEIMLLDHLHHLGLGVLGAGEEVGLGVLHVGDVLGVFHDGRDIGHPADVEAAVADKDPDPGRLVQHVLFRRDRPSR